MKRRISLRNSRGVLADSAVGLWLVISGMIAGALILVNGGAFVYYKIKLGFIANQTALYASGLPQQGTNNTPAINAFAQQDLKTLGFNPSSTTVTIDSTSVTVNGRPAIKITLTSPLATLLPMTGIIPQTVTMSDSAVAVTRYWYWGEVQLLNPTGGYCTFPLVNSTGALPNDGLPAYECNLISNKKLR